MTSTAQPEPAPQPQPQVAAAALLDRLQAYGMAELYARCGYEAVRAFLALAGYAPPMPDWEHADPREREMMTEGVRSMIADPDPERLHARWYLSATAAGWRYGERVDHAARTHPALVPYAALNPHQIAAMLVYIDSVKTQMNALMHLWALQGRV